MAVYAFKMVGKFTPEQQKANDYPTEEVFFIDFYDGNTFEEALKKAKDKQANQPDDHLKYSEYKEVSSRNWMEGELEKGNWIKLT